METIEQFINRHLINKEKSSAFVDYLFEMMNKYKIDNAAEVYKKIGVSRQTWSAIISKKITPSLYTTVKIALALKLNNHECKYLLKKVGYTLSSSSYFALIIRYCIENNIYDVYEVNSYLEKYGITDFIEVK